MGKVCSNLFRSGLLLVLLFPAGAWSQGLELSDPRVDTDQVLTPQPQNTGPFLPLDGPGRFELLKCNLAPVQKIVRAQDPRDTSGILVGIWSVFEKWKVKPGEPDQQDNSETSSNSMGLSGHHPKFSDAFQDRRLEKRLENCKVLRDQIIWQEPDGTKIPYVNWSPEKKARLDTLFQKLVRKEHNLGIQCPVVSEALVPPHYLFYYDYDEAFDVFAAHVAHVLYLEAKDLVPWKVFRMAPVEIAQLLDSENYFSIIKPSTKIDYPDHIVPGEDYQPLGWSQPYGPMLCNPRYAYQAFHELAYNAPQFQESIVGPDMETTLANLTLWFRDHVHHGTQALKSMPEEFIHGYMTVASRFLLKEYDGKRRIVAYSGCHQAAGLMKEIARSFNIPLLLVASQDAPTRPGIPFPSRFHKGLCFKWSGAGGRCLWHLDEIYAYSYQEPTFAIDDQGQPMEAAAANGEYFRTHWVPINELPGWGFEWVMEDTLPNNQNGHLFYSIKGSAEEYYNYGPFLGYWHLSDRGQELWDEDGGQTPYNEYLDLSQYMRFVHLVQTASYYLLQDPCQSINQVSQYDLSHRVAGLRASDPPPISFSSNELIQKMNEILQAYGDTWGDCSNIEGIRQSFADRRDSL